jgi:hypothetical protein
MNNQEHKAGSSPFFTERTIPLFLFLAGTILHLLYFGLIRTALPPAEWCWTWSDTDTYVQPAESFLRDGVFGRDGIPEYRRTIGYPLFLAFGMKTAAWTGIDWRTWVYVLQAVVFALAYPALYHLARRLFGLTRRVALACLALILTSGVFVSYVPVLLSDALFATAFITGISSGVAAIEKRSWAWALLHAALIAYAANIRPMLVLFSPAALILHGSLAGKLGRLAEPRVRRLLAGMFLLTLAGSQTPALRNKLHHGAWVASELGSNALYDYLAREVLRHQGREAIYQTGAAQIDRLEGPRNIGKRAAARKQEAVRVFMEYPLTTAAAMAYNELLNMVETHWNNTLFYMARQTWYKDYVDGSVRWSPAAFAVGLFFVMVYGVLYLAAGIRLIALRKRWAAVFAITLFLFPMAISATNYQGARFRLWLEPFVVLCAASAATCAGERRNRNPVSKTDWIFEENH